MQVFSDSGVNAFNPSLVGGTGTTAKIFVSLLGPGFNLGGANLGAPPPSSTLPTVPTPSASTPAAKVQIPGTGQFEQQQMEVRASGFAFVHGTSPTLNFVFQQGSSLTPGSNTTMATGASATALTTNATYPWMFRAFMQGDSVSGILQIQQAFFDLNGTAVSLTLTDLTGINFTTTNYPFVFGITFGVSDATNVASLSQFQLGT